MAIFTRENGKMAKLMVKVYSWTQMDPCMKESGSTINNMDLVLNHGSITKSNSRETLSMARRLVRADLSSKVDFMREISSMGSSMDSENTTSLTLVSFMRENSEITIWKERVSWSGLISQGTREISRMERWKEKEPKYLHRETNILDSGKTTFSMELVCSSVLKIKLKDKESGQMAKEALG
jgi:hypothetical protein